MDLYYLPASAPCRSVQMTAAALGCKINLIYTDLFAGDHMKPNFLKINPQHMVPTLVDNGFALWESRPICIYLVEKYGGTKNSFLYPKNNVKKRALINQRLYFDVGVLYKSFADYYYPQLFMDQPADPEKYEAMDKAMEYLNTFLVGNKYVTGNEMTIADICISTSISTFEVAGFNLSKYTNVAEWFELCKQTIPSFSLNQAGAEEFGKLFKK